MTLPDMHALGKDVTVGQEVKLGNRWRTVTSIKGEPHEDTQVVETVDASGRERMAKILLRTYYKLRKGGMAPELRYRPGESATIRENHTHPILYVENDDGGPMVRVRFRRPGPCSSDEWGQGSTRHEMNVNRSRLSPSAGQRAKNLREWIAAHPGEEP